MSTLDPRPWVPGDAEAYVQRIADETSAATSDALDGRIHDLIELNRVIHEDECINLNPATNTMNPRAEAALASGLGSRPSLGYPGEKYEMGLEAIEQIEVIAAELAAETFGARFAEVRVGSGALANLYVFTATTTPGDTIIAPPAAIGGHVTHHRAGAAGLHHIRTVDAPIDAANYTVDFDALADLARAEGPAVISIGGSMNLSHHPVAEIRAIADEVGAIVLFDAAHLSGVIAGGAWPNPLDEGAHAMTMSTYKSLGGPPAGLVVTNDANLAERIDAIAFPGYTANFDAANTAALALTLLDWREHGAAYAGAMIDAAQALSTALASCGLDPQTTTHGHTLSHQVALDAQAVGGGTRMARHLRDANLLTCAIGLPSGDNPADAGVRLGTNEIVRWGMVASDMGELADLIARAWNHKDPSSTAPDVTAMRRRFDRLVHIR